MSNAPLISIESVSKRFGETLANDDVSFAIRPGEIHALLGENGAGKSTLVKILYGALQADSGRVVWEGSPVTIANPAAARRLGIAMVFQHFSLFEALSVSENIALALPPETTRTGLSARIEEVSAEYGLPLKASAIVADLSVGERQRIERKAPEGMGALGALLDADGDGDVKDDVARIGMSVLGKLLGGRR